MYTEEEAGELASHVRGIIKNAGQTVILGSLCPRCRGFGALHDAGRRARRSPRRRDPGEGSSGRSHHDPPSTSRRLRVTRVRFDLWIISQF